MKHISRPWKVGWKDRGLGHGDYGVIGETGQLIAEIKTGMKDDARLIAAAPDLLEVCKEMKNQFVRLVQDSESWEIIERAKQAIAKAESEE